MAIQEGDTATDGAGRQIMFKGGKWEPVAPTVGSPVAPKKMSAQDRIALNKMDEAAVAASEVGRQYKAAKPIINKLGTGPFRGMFLDAAMPEDGGGMLDKIGATIIGGPSKLLGLISPEDASAYQQLKALQAQRTLAVQSLQRGTQTEGDAARIKAGDISPYMETDANLTTLDRGADMATRSADRAPFFTQWANKYGGVNALDENGHSAEQQFQATRPDHAQRTVTRIK